MVYVAAMEACSLGLELLWCEGFAHGFAKLVICSIISFVFLIELLRLRLFLTLLVAGKMGLVSQLSESAKANPFALPVRTAKCSSSVSSDRKLTLLYIHVVSAVVK